MPPFFNQSLVEGVRAFGPQRELDILFTYRPSREERVARNLRGWYTSAQAEMRPALEELAIELQQMQVAELHREMGAKGGVREQRGTHYLEDAIMSPRNRRVSSDGMVVGLEEALNETPAGSYWRGLEEGTSVHIGQRMYGLWVTPGGFAPPQEGARDAIGFLGWRNIPADVADEYRNERGRLPGFRIHRAIRPYHYLRQGIETFVESGVIGEKLREAVGKATARLERE